MKIHQKENNQESQQHLEENKDHFSAQCLKVLEILQQGKRLTVKSAMNQYEIWSLPRRILDLKEKGIDIHDEWILDKDGKTKIKQWFLAPKTEQSLQEFLSELQNEKQIPDNRPSQIDLF